MALDVKNPEDEESNQSGIDKSLLTPQSATQAVSPTTSRIPRKKATGFTNLNRIMQANQGNRLASSIASSVSSEVERNQAGVGAAYKKFEEEAEKNRLDSEKNIKERAGILSKFNQPVLAAPVQTPVKPPIQPYPIGVYPPVRPPVQTPVKPPIQPYPIDVAGTPNKVKSASSGGLLSGGFLGGIGGVPSSREKSQAELDRLLNSGLLGGIFGGGNPKYSTEMGMPTTQAERDAVAQAMATSTGSTATPALPPATSPIVTMPPTATAYSAPVLTDADIAAFQKYRTGAYAGPEELKDYGSLLGRASQVEDLSRLAGTYGGRQELLSKFVGKDNYTLGQKTLDEAILAQDPSSGLSAAARTARGALQKVQGANLQAAAKAQEFKNLAKIFSKQTLEEIEKTKTPYSSQVDKLVQEAKKKEDERVANIQSIKNLLVAPPLEKIVQTEGGTTTQKIDNINSALQKAKDFGYLSSSDISEFTKSGGLIDRAKKLNLNIDQLLLERINEKAAENLNRTGVASSDQMAALNALDRLAGKAGTDLEFRDQARLTPGSVGFDLDSLKNYLAQAEQSGVDPNSTALIRPPSGGLLDAIHGIIGGIGTGVGNVIHEVGIGAGNVINEINPFDGSGWSFSDKDLKKDITYNQKDVDNFLDRLKPASYNYKDEVKNSPFASPDRQIGVMAQDLEKSKLGKDSVINTEMGKVVDYKELQPKMLASLASLNNRLKKIENK